MRHIAIRRLCELMLLMIKARIQSGARAGFWSPRGSQGLLVLLVLGGSAWRGEAAEIRFENESAYMVATGTSANSALVIIEPHPGSTTASRSSNIQIPQLAPRSSNVFYRGYRFELITNDEGFFPSINNFGEIVYEKYDPSGNINVFSTSRGWITDSTSGDARKPDINDSGEVVFCDNPTQAPGPGPWTVWSTVRGSIGMGCSPSISNNGEIVYEDTQSFPRLLKSTTRGILATFSSENTTLVPDVNDFGEVVYQAITAGNTQIFSTERGQLTFSPPLSGGVGFPTINNDGEVIFTAQDEDYRQQLFSTVRGRLTDESLFPYPTPPDSWTGLEPFGLYFSRVGYGSHVNDKGQIVFSVVLVEGPYCGPRGCSGVARIRLYLATPVIPVTIDIKPGDFTRTINVKSKGVIPVAVLTTKTFDATTVDAATVRFGKTGLEAAAVRSTLRDIDGNGALDMVLYFNSPDTGIGCADTVASLTGETSSNQAIRGSEAIVTVGCK